MQKEEGFKRWIGHDVPWIRKKVEEWQGLKKEDGKKGERGRKKIRWREDDEREKKRRISLRLSSDSDTILNSS